MDDPVNGIKPGKLSLFAALGLDPKAMAQEKAAKAEKKRLREKLKQQPKRIPLQDAKDVPAGEHVASKTFDLTQWRATYYTIFIRKNLCKYCHREETFPERGVFLSYRRVGYDPASSRIYLPVKIIEFTLLPRRTEITVSTSPVCLHCFQEYPCQETSAPDQSELSRSPQEHMLSEVSAVQSSAEDLSGTSCLGIENFPLQQDKTSLDSNGSDGSSSPEETSGITCARFDRGTSNQDADAQPIPSPIGMELSAYEH